MYQAMSLVLAGCWSLHLIPTAGTGIIMILQEDTEEKKKGRELEGEQSSVNSIPFLLNYSEPQFCPDSHPKLRKEK